MRYISSRTSTTLISATVSLVYLKNLSIMLRMMIKAMMTLGMMIMTLTMILTFGEEWGTECSSWMRANATR